MTNVTVDSEKLAAASRILRDVAEGKLVPPQPKQAAAKPEEDAAAVKLANDIADYMVQHALLPAAKREETVGILKTKEGALKYLKHATALYEGERRKATASDGEKVASTAPISPGKPATREKGEKLATSQDRKDQAGKSFASAFGVNG